MATYTKVKVSEIGQDRYNLVLMPEGCDKGTDMFASSQVVKKF